ncbi:MAG: BrnA antitoxin family protein [Syntrophobacterales bacterium]|nr:BrnA antitoxin family protein [Syntrophobacterales bacterium]
MKTITAKEFDEKFDAGEDVLEYCNLDNILRPGLEQRRVNVDFPAWMIERLDQAARELGVTRQSVIKFWIAERLKTSV